MTEVEQQAPAPTTEAPAKEEVVEEKKVEAEGENKDEEKKDEEKKEDAEKEEKVKFLSTVAFDGIITNLFKDICNHQYHLFHFFTIKFYSPRRKRRKRSRR